MSPFACAKSPEAWRPFTRRRRVSRGSSFTPFAVTRHVSAASCMRSASRVGRRPWARTRWRPPGAESTASRIRTLFEKATRGETVVDGEEDGRFAQHVHQALAGDPCRLAAVVEELARLQGNGEGRNHRAVE